MKQLKFNLRRVALLLVLLFAALIIWGGWSYLVNGNRWFSHKANTFSRKQKSSVVPGDIYDVNGILIATSDETGARAYQQDEASRKAVVHVLGDNHGNVSNGVESFMSNYLYGFSQSYPERLRIFFSGKKRKGDTVQLTIDSLLSTYILNEISSDPSLPEKLKGAVVVMNYKTGAVLAELSFPAFDPYKTRVAEHDAGQPFYNRAVQGLYAPGSTFKIVTAAAALNAGIKDNDTFVCSGNLEVDGHVITDAETKDIGNIRAHGTITLRDAFKKSCNNTFAYLALQLGDKALRKQAENFGFGEDFRFRDLVVENSSYGTDNRTDWKIAWSGAGQADIIATPMHMCMIAAAIANDGVMMEPRLIQLVADADGNVRVPFTSKEYRTVIKDEKILASLRDYMRAVVSESGGTGRAASVSGYKVYGKTGSAEKDGQENANAWFIGYLGSSEYPYAVSIVFENAGGGGTYAAPVAQKIFSWLINNKGGTQS